MAVFEPGEPRSPRARSFLEYLRGVAALVCLGLLAYTVVNNRPIEQQVFLTAAAGLFLGLDIYDRTRARTARP